MIAIPRFTLRVPRGNNGCVLVLCHLSIDFSPPLPQSISSPSSYISPYETHPHSAISRRINSSDSERSAHLIANNVQSVCMQHGHRVRPDAPRDDERRRRRRPTAVVVRRQADCGCDGTCAPVAGTHRPRRPQAGSAY